MKKIILSLFLFLVLFLGCENKPKTVINNRDVQIIQKVEIGQQQIIYIDYYGQDFIDKTEIFMKHNPNFKIISIWGNGRGSYGNDLGYYLLIERFK